ncbi:MAG: chemotaxis protein CheW, partial [Gemmataceae bacterium]
PPAELEDHKLVWHLGTIEPGTERRLQVIVLPNHPDEIPDDADGLFQLFQCLTSRSRLLKSNVTVAIQVPESAQVSTPVVLGLEAHNKGNGAARDLQFRVRLPDGVTHAGGDVIDFTVPLLIGGDRKALETSVTATRPGEHVLPLLLVVADQEHEVGRATLTAAAAPEPMPVVTENRLPRLTLAGPLPESPLGSTDEPHLLFTLADTDYAAPVANVVEVARVPAVTPLPKTPAWLRGAAAVGGELVGLIDLRVFLGLPPAEASPAARVLLVRPLGGEPAAALLVDAVVGVRSVKTALPGNAGLNGHDQVLPFVAGVAELAGALLIFLDLERVLFATESIEPPSSAG